MIDRFDGTEYRFLSNFYTHEDMVIEYKGLIYTSTEAAYQAQKEKDPLARVKYTKMTPAQSKKAGKKADIVPNWEKKKEQVMLDLLRIKFSIPFLAEQLIATHPHELVEGNWWGDIWWGICQGVGQNKLGKLLMKVRKEIMDAQELENKEIGEGG